MSTAYHVSVNRVTVPDLASTSGKGAHRVERLVRRSAIKPAPTGRRRETAATTRETTPPPLNPVGVGPRSRGLVPPPVPDSPERVTAFTGITIRYGTPSRVPCPRSHDRIVSSVKRCASDAVVSIVSVHFTRARPCASMGTLASPGAAGAHQFIPDGSAVAAPGSNSVVKLDNSSDALRCSALGLASPNISPRSSTIRGITSRSAKSRHHIRRPQIRRRRARHAGLVRRRLLLPRALIARSTTGSVIAPRTRK